jgi:hypothetical protein
MGKCPYRRRVAHADLANVDVVVSQICINLLEDGSVFPIVCCAIFGQHNWSAPL